MRINSILLSSAALVASATVGFAADLPSKKAAPVEYVRVCSQFGAGFWYVPGTDTCIKLSGRVRAEYYYNEPLTRASNATSTRARGYVALDSYTATDWGPVRATTRIFVDRDSGRQSSLGVWAGNSSSANGVGATAANVDLEWAYIQFAGFTAGRLANSFFDFAPFGGVSFVGGGTNGRGNDKAEINALAYTFNAGNGFTATLSLEDGTERRVGVVGDTTATGQVTAPAYAGHAVPDIVARLDYTQSWGQVVLMGAMHQTRVQNGTVAAPVEADPNEFGYAIQGGVKINLPMLAAGDALFLQAAYASGASSYTGFTGVGVADAKGTAYDAYFDANGNLKKVNTWSVTGGFEHYWIPTLSTAIFASYGSFEGGTIRTSGTSGATGLVNDDWKFLAVGANVKWSPVKNLLIGAEAVYQKAVDTPNGYFQPAVTARQDNIWSGRLRVQRDF